MKIAIVEDDLLTQRMMRQMLIKGFPEATFTSFDRLAEAMTFAIDNPQDYWLVDLGLPDGSGIALISLLHKRYPQSNILVMTVLEDDKSIERSIRAGANGYILKQDLINEDQLPNMIKAIQDGGTPLSPVVANRLLARMHFVASQPMSLEAEHNLSPREVELMHLISRGYSYQESADLMEIGIGTVQSLIKRIYSKLAVNSRSEAVFEARSKGVLR